MNWKTKNEKGLNVSCGLCDWKFPVLESDDLKSINSYYKAHKCKEVVVVPVAPIVEVKEEVKEVKEYNSVNFLLEEILKELRKGKK